MSSGYIKHQREIHALHLTRGAVARLQLLPVPFDPPTHREISMDKHVPSDVQKIGNNVPVLS